MTVSKEERANMLKGFEKALEDGDKETTCATYCVVKSAPDGATDISSVLNGELNDIFLALARLAESIAAAGVKDGVDVESERDAIFDELFHRVRMLADILHEKDKEQLIKIY